MEAVKLNQKELILAYITRFGSISPLEAFRDLGITKLATRISELEQMGVRFKHLRESAKNRFGKTTNYMRYSMEDKNDQ